MSIFLTKYSRLALFCLILLTVLCACTNTVAPQETPGELLPSAEPSVVSTITPEIVASAPDYTGTWYRTNIPRSSYAELVISNQTATTFDYRFEGWNGANSGSILGTATFTEGGGAVEHIEPIEPTVYNERGDVEFSFIDETLWLSSTTAGGLPISPNEHIYVEGEFIRGEPVYTNANLLTEILPTEQLRENVLHLLGSEAYADMLDVFDMGVQIIPVNKERAMLTYEGFVSGIGLGVDLQLNGDLIYLLLYKIYAGDHWVYKFFTNDIAYTTTLPPFMEDATAGHDYPVKFIYKSTNDTAPQPGSYKHTAFIAETLGLATETANTLELIESETARTSKDSTATVYHYGYQTEGQHMSCHHVAVVDFGDRQVCKELNEGYNIGGDFHLADIDGDSVDELIMRVIVGITGGAGQHSSYIYKIGEDDVTEMFNISASQYDTGFTLTLTDGYMLTVENLHTDLSVTFEHRYDGEYDNSYFDSEGAAIVRSVNRFADLSFYEFVPVDIDGDRVFEIMASQYCSLYSHADGIGAAYTILRWNKDLGAPEVIDAGFWEYEDYAYEDREDYSARWTAYEESWYRSES